VSDEFIRKISALELECKSLELKNLALTNEVKKYEELVEKIKSSYNYEEPSKNAYVCWFNTKKQLGHAQNLSFPNFIEELVTLLR
jgi:hypothetical protein